MNTLEREVEGHRVTLGVSSDRGVFLLVNRSVKPITEEDPRKRLKLALAARQLWRETLGQLPPGVYWCYPATPSLRRVYLANGWEPSPVEEGELLYYHQVSCPSGVFASSEEEEDNEEF